MKMVFIHDGPVYYDKEMNYYEFAFHKLYERYHYFADEVSFLMRTYPSNSNKRYTKIPHQVKIISFENINTPSELTKNYLKTKRIVHKCIEENDCFVIRVPSVISLVAIKYIKKSKKPYIIECVGCAWDTYWNLGIIGKMVAPIMFLGERKIIKQSKYVCYVTEKFLQHRYPTNGLSINASNVVIENDDDEVLSKRLKRIRRQSKRIVIGTSAILDTKYKCQDYVIKTVAALVKKGIDIEYRLAGGTQKKDDTFPLIELTKKYKLENKVKFLGSLSAYEMDEYYDGLDLYIQPSKQEGLPRAVIEAMSRGCPVIGSNVGGIPELIDPECIFSVNCKSIEEKIIYMMNTDLEKYAIRNFNFAKKYEYDLLVMKRNQFYDTFRKNESI